MASTKVDQSYTINEPQAAWLREMAEKYELSDESKALRIVLDHAMTVADRDAVFTIVRCHHCS